MIPGLSLSPLVPLWLLAALAVAALAAAILAVVARRGAGLVRALALALLVAALTNPSLVNRQTEPVRDVVAVAVDRSLSQTLGGRTGQTETAIRDIEARLKELPGIEPRIVTVGDAENGDGTRLFGGLAQALADVPPERIAGAILLTDGVVHDIPRDAAALGFRAPVHALVTGRANERDRRIVLVDAPRFGLVGKDQTIRARLDERGGPGRARVVVRRDGQQIATLQAVAGPVFSIPVRIEHGGPNVVEIEVEPLEGELTPVNNRAVVTIDGIREKLRVLLVSGEPHSGERTWRNLLKSDANVDLVHFTILRPPEKQDGTPINELSLIAFPTRELFQIKIKEFDLIILDRYANQSILPSLYYDNIARYVRDGGALLVAAGPEYSTPSSLARTPLAPVLPALPDGQVVEEPYRALITDRGVRHPVTRDLPGSNTEPPSWGEWLRIVGSRNVRGETVMTGFGDRPLVVLNREGKGRVALLLSDHAWLWARGFRDGGPHVDLLRRLSHWLMKEPELEEEALRAYATGSTISIERQTMAETVAPARLTGPGGAVREIALTQIKPGVFSGTVESRELGLHRVDHGDLTAFVGLGPANPRELVDVFSDTERLRPLAESTGGSVRRIAAEPSGALALPRIVALRAGTSFAGSDWIAIRPTDSARVTGVSLLPLMLGAMGLLLLLLPLVAAWLVEGGRLRRRAPG